MQSFHAVARTRYQSQLFFKTKIAKDLWSRLREGFPVAHAAVIMPNHVHLLTPSVSAEEIQYKLKNILRCLQLSQQLGAHVFEPNPLPVLIPDTKHLLRQIRYVHLNPCRSKWVDDPLAWPWSTHRHALGLGLESWTGISKTLRALGYKSDSDLKKFHHYVSADATVKVQGTAWPKSATQNLVPQYGIPDLVASVRAASLLLPEQRLNSQVRRQLYWLMMDQGFREPRLLSTVLGVTLQRIHQIRNLESLTESELSLLRHYLGDSRLRHGFN